MYHTQIFIIICIYMSSRVEEIRMNQVAEFYFEEEHEVKRLDRCKDYIMTLVG